MAVLGAAVAGVVVVVATTGGRRPTVTACRPVPGPPLPTRARGSVAQIKDGAKRIVAREARDPGTPLGAVVRGSGYSYERAGHVSYPGDLIRGRVHRRTIGATFVIRLSQPHQVDTVVPSWSDPWPARSPQARFSRRFGYVPFHARWRSPGAVEDVAVDVDMRTKQVIAVGPIGDLDGRLHPLGHCPLRPATPD